MATVAKQLRQHLNGGKQLTVAHRRSLFSSKRIAYIRFSKIYDNWNSKVKIFIAKAQAYNADLKKAQKGRIAGQINDSDEKIMRSLLTILGKDMELLRKSNPQKYIAMMRPECPYLELRASRPSIAAMVKKLHTKGVSVGTITNSFNRFEKAGNRFIYERKHTSSRRNVYKHPDGSVSISYSYVKKGRGELIIRINKAILAWNIAEFVNTQNADNHFFKAPQKQILEQPNKYNLKQDKEEDNKCGQVPTVQEGDATHHLSKKTTAIAVEDKLSGNDSCNKQNSRLKCDSLEKFSGGGGKNLAGQASNENLNKITPVAKRNLSPSGGGQGEKLSVFPTNVQKTDISKPRFVGNLEVVPENVRQITTEGELYLQKQREDQAIRNIFSTTAKDNYAQRLWLILLQLLYPNLSANFRRKHEETCLASLKIIMKRTKMFDGAAFKAVALAIVKVHRHLNQHPEKWDKLYSPIGFLNPEYKGGLMDAVQDWILDGFIKNMKQSEKDSKERIRILKAHQKGREVFTAVVKTHTKTHHGANAAMQAGLNDLEKYFRKNKTPEKTRETVRTEYWTLCSGLLQACEDRIREQPDLMYNYFKKYLDYKGNDFWK